jgi:hypothetical protein
MPAFDLESEQFSDLNASWNIFVIHKCESVRLFIHGMGGLDLLQVGLLTLLMRCHKHYRHLMFRRMLLTDAGFILNLLEF